jgi:diacylglycerol kinase family enzyme
VLPLLIVNPTSAAGRTGRRYQDEAHAIRGALGPFEARFTNAVGPGAALARQAAGEGRPLVVAVGGDGTASEVLDGLQQAGHRGAFGFLPRGTGGDLRRTLRLPDDLGLGARALREAPPRAIDLGLVEFTANDGARVTRHFVNVASCGIGAVVVKRVNASSKALGGRLTFKLASARELLGWRDRRVRWRADGGPWTETPITAFSVCNGRYFGGGMMVAPGARIDDGLLDVTIGAASACSSSPCCSPGSTTAATWRWPRPAPSRRARWSSSRSRASRSCWRPMASSRGGCRPGSRCSRGRSRCTGAGRALAAGPPVLAPAAAPRTRQPWRRRSRPAG